MYVYQVGTLYHPDRTSWPETPSLRMTTKGHDLTLFYSRPTSAEVQAVRNGVAQFAWVDAGAVGVLAFRLGDLPWADCPYHPYGEEEAGLWPAIDELAPGQHQLVHLVLVDAATGIIRAQRALTWPAQFVRVVRTSVTRMLEAPHDQAASDAALDALYEQYPTHELAALRAAATCVGGRG